MEQLQNYCLRWNSYQTNLVRVFEEMLKNENFTDVTIVTENGAKFKCHKMILAACSKFFQDIFTNVPSEQHLVVLLKDVKANDMSHILEYMYTGQVNVEQSRLTSIIRTAEELQIKGLTGDEKLTKTEEEQMEEHPSRPSSNHVPTVVQSSSMHSPPHSTNSMYKNPYSNMYSKMHPNDRANMNLPMWHVPGLPMSHAPTLDTSPSNRFSGPSPPMMPAYEQPPAEVYHHRRKKFSSNMMPKDTPILRTVLGQGQDLSQPVSLVVNHGDIKQEHVENERKRRRTEEARENNQSSNHYHTEEDVKPRIIMPSCSPSAYTNDRRLTSPASPKRAPAKKQEGTKRYKQYSNNDLNGALDDVRSGMSALMAAKRHRVPSRTLYDKVKKMGIKTEKERLAENGSSPDDSTPNSQPTSPLGTPESEKFPLNNNATKTSLSEAEQIAAQKFYNMAAALVSNSNHGYSMNVLTSSPQMRSIAYNRLSSRCSADSDNHSELSHLERDHEEDQVEDLSMNRRQEGVIVTPMKQVTTIVNDGTQRDRNECTRTNVNYENTTT